MNGHRPVQITKITTIKGVKKMKKSLIIPTIVLGLGALTFATSKVMADDNVRPFNTRIAEHFGLNQDEVDDFMGQMHEERQAEMGQRHQERVNSLIEDGTLTEDQAKMLEDRHEEMRAEKEANLEQWRNMSREEKQAQMEDHHQENQQWAEENGIDLSAISMSERGFSENGFGRRGK